MALRDQIIPGRTSLGFGAAPDRRDQAQPVTRDITKPAKPVTRNVTPAADEPKPVTRDVTLEERVKRLEAKVALLEAGVPKAADTDRAAYMRDWRAKQAKKKEARAE